MPSQLVCSVPSAWGTFSHSSPIPRAIPRTSGTPPVAAPRRPVHVVKSGSTGVGPPPQNQTAFAGSLPCALRSRLTGCASSTSRAAWYRRSRSLSSGWQVRRSHPSSPSGEHPPGCSSPRRSKNARYPEPGTKRCVSSPSASSSASMSWAASSSVSPPPSCATSRSPSSETKLQRSAVQPSRSIPHAIASMAARPLLHAERGAPSRVSSAL